MRFIKEITCVNFQAIWSIFRGRTLHQNILQYKDGVFCPFLCSKWKFRINNTQKIQENKVLLVEMINCNGSPPNTQAKHSTFKRQHYWISSYSSDSELNFANKYAVIPGFLSCNIKIAKGSNKNWILQWKYLGESPSQVNYSISNHLSEAPLRFIWFTNF